MGVTASPQAPASLARASRVAREAFLAWSVLALGAIANGSLREFALRPWLGEGVARIASIGILVAIILAVSFWLVRKRWSALSTRALVTIGASWAIGSALFEFGLGRLVLDIPWSELLAAYDLSAGQYWILAPLAMLAGPAIARSLIRRRAR